MKRRLFTSILAVFLLMGLAIPAFATETTEATEETTEATEETKERREFSMEKEGECGDDLTWVLEDHTLTITGDGEMDDGCPWEFYKDTIETVIFNGEITNVGANAFDSCNNLEYVYFGEALVEIGEKAFFSCNSLETILLPATFRKFGPECFKDCENLDEIYCEGGMPSFKSSCLYNDHTVVVRYTHQNPWPMEEVQRLMTNFGGRIYVQVGSAEEWEEAREDQEALRAQVPEVAEETVPVTEAVETEPVQTTPVIMVVPVATQPAVVQTEPMETTVQTEPAVQETVSTEPVEIVFVEPERDMVTGETEPKTLEENLAEKAGNFPWKWVVLGAVGLTVLLVLALIIRSVSHKGGKYSD